MARIRKSATREKTSSSKAKFAAFDLETRRLVDNNKMGLEKGKLGVTCIGLMLSGQQSPEMWFGEGTDGEIADQMSRDHLNHFVDRLVTLSDDGFTIMSWNGLNFDFRVLATESGRVQDCQSLAIDHVDVMFNIFCDKGWPVAIAQVASGMGLKGKTLGMDGVEAVRIWNEQPHRRKDVVEYAARDVQITLRLAELGHEQRLLRWRSQSGNLQQLRLLNGWLSCNEADRSPEPDNSWMDNPISRSYLKDWVAIS